MSLDSPPTPLRGLIIAAPRSGAGKTTVSLGLMRALRRRGTVVQPFKCGPDYIDPAHHALAAGRESINLDTWAMPAALVQSLLARAALGADIAIVEGVMGLFDGAAGEGQCGRGSTADVARLTGWPIVLVLDVSGQAETAAAVALGLARYREDVRVAGVILNRVASPRHRALMEPGFQRIGLPVLGAIGRDERMRLGERHLGLVQASELADAEARMDGLADVIAGGVDLDRVQAAAVPAQVSRRPSRGSGPGRLGPPGQRVAVARDRAFAFFYAHMAQQWRDAGAEILPFSPLADEAPCAQADAVWLPGGYPELHAATLAAAETFKTGVRALAARGVPIHGECGGYMVLGQGLVDAQGVRHEMLGLLGLETSFAPGRLHLGYRRARTLSRSVLGPAACHLMGHEFHYATITEVGDEPLVTCVDAEGKPVAEGGSRRMTVTGTFFHLIDVFPT